jgi:hypothetical protein
MLRGAKRGACFARACRPRAARLRIPSGGWFQQPQAPDRDTRFEAMQNGPLAATFDAGGGTRTRTPPRGTPDFKSPRLISAYLGRSGLSLLVRPIRSSRRRRHLGLSRRVSLPLLMPPAAIGYRSPGSRRCPCGSPSPAAWFRTETPLPADTTATCGGGSSSIAGSTPSASIGRGAP